VEPAVVYSSAAPSAADTDHHRNTVLRWRICYIS